MNAIDLLDATARRMGRQIALIDEHGRALTFASFADRTRHLAALLLRARLQPGDAVVLMMSPGSDFYAVCAAVLRAGLVAVVPDRRCWRANVAEAAASMRIGAIVGTPFVCALRPFVRELRRVPRALVAGRFPGVPSIRDVSRVAPLAGSVSRDADAVALVSFTSGTTGPPKGVLRSHRVLAATERLLADQLELEPGETQLSVLPLFVLANLAAGVTSVLPDPRAARPARSGARALARQIAARRVQVLVASPAIATALAAHAVTDAPLHTLRRIYLGGAPVTPSLLDACARAAPNAQISAVYGATEVEPIARCSRSDYGPDERRVVLEGGGLLAGVAPPGVAVRVLAGSVGGDGEIIVSGDNVSPGYLGGVAAEANVIVDGMRWHRTGDAGRIDAGRLWLTGRCADGVRTPNGIVHPLRVEAALAGELGVRRAALLDDDGRRVIAVEAVDRTALALQKIAERVAFACAHDIVVVDRMPLDRRHGAKIDYVALAALLRRRRWRMRRSVA